MAKAMHIAQYLMHGPTYHSIAMWRHPRTDQSYDWRRPELYQHIAQVCERGKLDMVFFADFNYIFDAYQNAPDTALRYAAQTNSCSILPEGRSDGLTICHSAAGGPDTCESPAGNHACGTPANTHR